MFTRNDILWNCTNAAAALLEATFHCGTDDRNANKWRSLNSIYEEFSCEHGDRSTSKCCAAWREEELVGFQLQNSFVLSLEFRFGLSLNQNAEGAVISFACINKIRTATLQCTTF